MKVDHSRVVTEKINDKQLRENLSSAMHTLQTNRKNLIQKRFTNWEELRDSGKASKNNTLTNLKERLLEFEENATKNGFIIHWAKDGNEACEIIYKLMLEKNISKILKGKSMASEEIHLNHFLKEKGIDAIETDLGELIIQLIDEPPVHIVVPAIHKNRYEIGEIFKEHLNAPLESEPEKLNAIAREYMREEFKTLKMGLGGVNFAISKEGAIWMLENEGNGRMCTTIPDITVNICGIEKIVERFEDAAMLNTLLIPSATGQFITNYNNIITGPRQEGELDGPIECHIIMLDNNRSRMLTNKEYYEALRCIRCGACMNFCPVYDKVGGHSYKAVYPGPIGEVITPQLFGMDTNSGILTLCSLCGRCSEVCPVKIPLADLIRKLRRDKVGEGKNPPIGTDKLKKNKIEAMVFKGYSKVQMNGFAFRTAMKSAIMFNGIVHKFGDRIPVIKNWVAYKDLGEFEFDLHKEMKEMQGVIYE
ncbi:NAD-independent L-lactate dehydrogenase LldEFG, iron-sulfur cluster subunit [Campylobacter blaseri]|uniref:Iron-sulfur cluster-binding protein n=1 Tax=Campylobacter blaseri TaxID=2042961 RepID=A0A2P8R125_9BACT|nr:LutB/LldF family L-lactate oxidation iron-sulfur protein [Campylobacter blaseri]PSM52195.1 iron-sulfur cluster-binding protein [Campylobacter blaseri]PSM53961.1 iron-sulfur cluster-binding protein [Campylobacter blaseri]QKF85398.1 NAD-independent L-lactate dehydrogenase LldEFG, iron-sulfur cluster subunit [Campylobacter blaseri]